MVLHHVAQCAGLVIIARAVFKPDGFGHGDLHMVDMGRIPQWFVQGIGKAQCHQVLYCLLAEVVIDAEDLLFVEDVADRVVEGNRRFKVAADRLFHDDARMIVNELVALQAAGDIRRTMKD